MFVTTISLQGSHVDPHKQLIVDHQESAYSIGMVAAGHSATHLDDTKQQNSLKSELSNKLVLAVVPKYRPINVSDFTSYFLNYAEFNSHAKSTLISYLHQQSLP